jgi:hypothetical protein
MNIILHFLKKITTKTKDMMMYTRNSQFEEFLEKEVKLTQKFIITSRMCDLLNTYGELYQTTIGKRYETVDQVDTVDRVDDLDTADRVDDPDTVDRVDARFTADRVDARFTADRVDDRVTVDRVDDRVTVDRVDDRVTVDRVDDRVTVDRVDDRVTSDPSSVIDILALLKHQTFPTRPLSNSSYLLHPQVFSDGEWKRIGHLLEYIDPHMIRAISIKNYVHYIYKERIMIESILNTAHIPSDITKLTVELGQATC